MTDQQTSTSGSTVGEETALEGVNESAYSLLRGRLEQAAQVLRDRANELNLKRLETFGSSRFELLGTERVRTEANAIPRDVINVGDELVLAYNAEVGLSDTVRAEDVFGVHRMESREAGGDVTFSPNPEGLAGSVLDDDQFRRDFDELHTYYKSTTLQQTYRVGSRLLAVFRTGRGTNDVRVLRWQISPDNQLRYLDARGERDHRFPAAQDIAWTPITRADHIDAAHIGVDDRVLLNPLGGTLDIRLDDGGEGSLLLQDSLNHADQSLQDCEVSWARSGDLVLVDMLPYGEDNHRYYVINLLVHKAVRLDSLGHALRQLPDGQGLIFPEGVYLKTGELRTFDLDVADMEMLDVVRSPNGEDVLYVFYEQQGGRSILLSYNVVRQEVAPPIWCHGFTIFDDGTMVVFREEPEPTRIHPMQIWATPFWSDEFAAAQPHEASPLDRIGNPALVSGIADALALARLVDDVEPSSAVYGDLLSSAGRLVDTHHWAGDEAIGNLALPATEIRFVAEQVLDEFERMQEVRAEAAAVLADAAARAKTTLDQIAFSSPNNTEAFIEGLAVLRREIGHLHTVRDQREIDVPAIDTLLTSVETAHNSLAQDAATFLSADDAFESYHERLGDLVVTVQSADSSIAVADVLTKVDELSDSMDLVAGTVGDLVVEDPRVRTSVLAQVSGVLAEVNRVRSIVQGRSERLIESETGAAFVTELGLLGQSIATAVGRAKTPEACDDALARLMLQLEQLETGGPRTEGQLDELAERRDQVTEALSARRQQLVDERQKRADRLVGAAERTLLRVGERALALDSVDDIHGFFAADPMVGRVRGLLDDLRDLGEPVRADELASQIGSARDGAIRGLRDRADLFDGDAIKLGRHRFSVDARKRELTVVPADGELVAVLTGTDLRVDLGADEVLDSQEFWNQPFASETPELYRATYLAGVISLGLTSSETSETDEATDWLPVVQAELDSRLGEGYDRGVHDVDAAAILAVIAPLLGAAGVLVAPSKIRARAQYVWAFGLSEQQRGRWLERGSSGAILGLDAVSMASLQAGLVADVSGAASHELVGRFLAEEGDSAAISSYLLSELLQPGPFCFASSSVVSTWCERLALDEEVQTLKASLVQDVLGATVLLGDHVRQRVGVDLDRLTDEIVANLLLDSLPRRAVKVDLRFEVPGLLGRHPSLDDGVLRGTLDSMLEAIVHHRDTTVPAYLAFAAARRFALADLRKTLRLDDLEPQVPEGFVRNQLIDSSYLPLIGDNLARQIGTVEDQAGARSGLLMLLSPPGYGKTTLVEYVAERLGMALVKVSGPGLGHEVTSLDPAQAPSATAAREIERINLAFAAGTNVILYLDDIQHTNPEFLQRFISLCDAQRRIEGVWDGQARTFDMRGKRFAVVMAGNPYTESGERFRIPDMLANRADTYNLGDVLSDNEAVFARSYLENALTANPSLAPLSGLATNDLERFFAAAEGAVLDESALETTLPSTQTRDAIATLAHLKRVQEVVLGVNRQYIASAATDDAYRTEPPFLLQGSYRNMARMASKLLPIMTVAEVEQIIDEHYAAESQALTGAAEWNLLRLAELRGTLTDEQRSRREDILNTFGRQQRLGGAEQDPTTRVVAAIEQVAEVLATTPAPVAVVAPAQAAVVAPATAIESGELAPLSDVEPPIHPDEQDDE